MQKHTQDKVRFHIKDHEMNDKILILDETPIPHEVAGQLVKRKPGGYLGQVKAGYIAVFGGGFIETKTKREMKKLLEKKGNTDVVIIRGKMIPSARVTKLDF